MMGFRSRPRPTSEQILTVIAGVLWFLSRSPASAAGAEIDLRKAVVVAPAALGRQESKALGMLVDEVRKRTRISWPIVTAWPEGTVPVIAVGSKKDLVAFAG